MSFDSQAFLPLAAAAARSSMVVIHDSFFDGQVLAVEVKEFDQTLVTVLDRKSEAACFPLLQAAFPGVPILREEAGLTEGSADWIIWVDALDGTSARTLLLPTSTVIIAAYSLAEKRLKAVVIGEPAYMRQWSASDDTPCQLFLPGKSLGVCRVWDGQFSERSTVFIDVSHSFVRKTASGAKKDVLSKWGAKALMGELQDRCRVVIPGSNGLNHALVANGGEYMAGAITTAMGGPWDVAGALLVKQAGGVIRAFSIEPPNPFSPADHEAVCDWDLVAQQSSPRRLKEVDPLDPLAYDLLVSANNEATADVLSEALSRAMRV